MSFLQCVKLQSLSKQKMLLFTIVSFKVSHSNRFPAIIYIMVFVQTHLGVSWQSYDFCRELAILRRYEFLYKLFI